MGIRDVRDRLATSLGAAYELGSELGDGGASRVFIAHEALLGRDVIVKVLAHALAEELSIERFAREIRLAAQLQHPHIVPVLTAGMTDDGLPFYTMPFVRGESLRARLDRGPLSVSEGVGILRDVLGALSYAHAHGVVHRDIKPENVLLSSDTAVVIDFGIAKALQASMIDVPTVPSPHGPVTGSGVWLGTPAYMAPEQVDGARSADHRVDLYAWGLLAYEVLAGRHPFAGWNAPQQLLAAQMAVMPTHLGAVAADVTPALAALVMWCLVKDPAGRPASAEDVRLALDDAQEEAVRVAAVPSGQTMVRAFVLYASAVVVVALLAGVATNVLGLPGWVLPGALVVMAVGLPVVVATGLELRHPHRKWRRQDKARSVTGEFAVRVRGLLSWRLTAWGGVAALSAFGLVVAGYMTLRTLGIGPAGSLLAAGIVARGEPVIVADFQVTRRDSALGAAASAAVRTTLGQSRVVTVVPVSEVVDALRRMERPSEGRVDATLARYAAQHAGVHAVVRGELTPQDDGFRVTLRLVAAATGEELATFRGTAEHPTDVIPTLDRLTRELRGKIGESFKAVRADPPR